MISRGAAKTGTNRISVRKKIKRKSMSSIQKIRLFDSSLIFTRFQKQFSFSKAREMPCGPSLALRKNFVLLFFIFGASAPVFRWHGEYDSNGCNYKKRPYSFDSKA